MHAFIVKRRSIESSVYRNRHNLRQMKRGKWITMAKYVTISEALSHHMTGLYEWSIWYSGKIVGP